MEGKEAGGTTHISVGPENFGAVSCVFFLQRKFSTEGGKYIAENLFVSGIYIPQAAEDENDFEVALDWIVVRVGSDSLRLTLRGGNLGNGGLELLYNMLLQ